MSKHEKKDNTKQQRESAIKQSLEEAMVRGIAILQSMKREMAEGLSQAHQLLESGQRELYLSPVESVIQRREKEINHKDVQLIGPNHELKKAIRQLWDTAEEWKKAFELEEEVRIESYFQGILRAEQQNVAQQSHEAQEARKQIQEARKLHKLMTQEALQPELTPEEEAAILAEHMHEKADTNKWKGWLIELKQTLVQYLDEINGKITVENVSFIQKQLEKGTQLWSEGDELLHYRLYKDSYGYGLLSKDVDGLTLREEVIYLLDSVKLNLYAMRDLCPTKKTDKKQVELPERTVTSSLSSDFKDSKPGNVGGVGFFASSSTDKNPSSQKLIPFSKETEAYKFISIAMGKAIEACGKHGYKGEMKLEELKQFKKAFENTEQGDDARIEALNAFICSASKHRDTFLHIWEKADGETASATAFYKALNRSSDARTLVANAFGQASLQEPELNSSGKVTNQRVFAVMVNSLFAKAKDDLEHHALPKM